MRVVWGAGVKAKLIPLSMWAERRYDPPPSERTLRRWRAAGNILPRPTKEGRGYRVPEHAQYIDPSDPDYLEKVAQALNESSPQ